jgi:hypothetical protein
MFEPERDTGHIKLSGRCELGRAQGQADSRSRTPVPDEVVEQRAPPGPDVQHPRATHCKVTCEEVQLAALGISQGLARIGGPPRT